MVLPYLFGMLEPKILFKRNYIVFKIDMTLKIPGSWARLTMACSTLFASSLLSPTDLMVSSKLLATICLKGNKTFTVVYQDTRK